MTTLPPLRGRGEAWKVLGHCRGEPTEMFFPAARDMAAVAAAKAVCEHCPVRSECLDYALANDVRQGVWGGLGEYSRRKLRRARRAGATGPPSRRDSTGPARGAPPPRPRRPAAPCSS